MTTYAHITPGDCVKFTCFDKTHFGVVGVDSHRRGDQRVVRLPQSAVEAMAWGDTANPLLADIEVIEPRPVSELETVFGAPVEGRRYGFSHFIAAGVAPLKNCYCGGGAIQGWVVLLGHFGDVVNAYVSKDDDGRLRVAIPA